MNRPYHWGILGTGAIANAFTKSLQTLSNAKIVAVGSRAQKTADRFARTFAIENAYSSYAALVEDPNVDIIYVATPHSHHHSNTLLALNHDKAVLCEKPFAVNVRESKEMIQTARERGVFLMEAMWTRFLPAIIQVQDWIKKDHIGRVRHIAADFGFKAPFNEKSRLFSPHLAGGALLDLGIYPISFTNLILKQPPATLASAMNFTSTGVDETTSMMFTYENSAMATLTCSIGTNMPCRAWIGGTRGTIEIHPKFWQASQATLYSNNNQETLKMPFDGTGFQFEAQHVMDCIDKGLLESPVMPQQETLDIMAILDQIRSDNKLVYPIE